ncbi:MAG: hypothetical protein F6K03_18640, partial [Kamptonema sp. SIO4C4]|nr:hypothetical protein [Kamptonema sp. SIO4C4]
AEPLEFLAQFGMVLTFSPDGSAAVMVDFNKNNPDKLYTRSLYLVNNQGGKELILDTQGSVISCEFDPTGEQLYCLLTKLIEDVEYVEQPYIAIIDLEKKEEIPLITLPDYQDIHISLAPDGLGLLFDQITTDPEADEEHTLKTNAGEAIASGQLWLLIPPDQKIADNEEQPPQLEELPFVGFSPQWIP